MDFRMSSAMSLKSQCRSDCTPRPAPLPSPRPLWTFLRETPAHLPRQLCACGSRLSPRPTCWIRCSPAMRCVATESCS
eukprot:15707_4